MAVQPSASRGLRWSVLAALLGQTLISALTYLAAKRAMHELLPLNVLLTRVLFSAAVFLAILVATPGRVLPPRSVWPTLLLFGFLVGPVNQGFFLFGLSRSSPAHAALLYALTPIGVYLVSLATRREQATWHRVVGIALAFAGVVVLLLGRGLKEAMGPLLGDLFILCAVAAWVFYTTEGKRVAAEHGPVRTTAWSMLAAGLWSLPAAPWLFDASALMRASTTAQLCVAFLIFFTSVVAYLLWYYALARTEASRVAVFANLQPVATAFAAWLMLGDPLFWEVYAGGALVLLGVRMAQRAVSPFTRGPG